MPVRVEYLENERGVLFECTGVVTADDLISSLAEAYSSEDSIRRYAYLLGDCRNATQWELSSDDIRHIADMDTEAFRINLSMIIALVMEKTAIYGFGRMWQILLDESNPRVKVFQSMDEAKRWIKEMRGLGSE